MTFAWPGNAISEKALPILHRQGILFARRGGGPEYPYEHGLGFAYQPQEDHPLLIPSAGDARPNWQIEDFIRAIKKTGDGQIAVLQFHGTPDTAHSWVNTQEQKFVAYMKYLSLHKYKVIALKDLAKYVDPQKMTTEPFKIIDKRKRELAKQEPAKK